MSIFPTHSSVPQPQPIGTSGDSARVKDWFVTCVRSTLEKLQDRVKVCTYVWAEIMYIRTYKYLHTYVNLVYVHVLMQCVNLHMLYVRIRMYVWTIYICTYVCTYLRMYIRTYVHMHMLHMLTCTHTHNYCNILSTLPTYCTCIHIST